MIPVIFILVVTKDIIALAASDFIWKKELIEGKCPDHQTKPEYRKESNYFFRMSKYQDWPD